MSLKREGSQAAGETTQDAITASEIAGDATPSASTSDTSKRQNAFTELMQPSKRAKPTPAPANPKPVNAQNAYNPRDGLGVYITNPASHPEVIEYDDDFVVIRDMYPKASVHILLLPRDPKWWFQHPLKALSSNPEFLTKVRKKAEGLTELVGKELQRLYGEFSESEHAFDNELDQLMIEEPESESDLNSDGDWDIEKLKDRIPPDVPEGRDWQSCVHVGVHTHPSMNHMHIHIISEDMHSPCLKHKKHYLSFNSSFFVRLNELPLKEDSPRYSLGDWPNWDMKCWRCNQNFKNKFKELKAHLEEEFEEWKQE